jgi:uncharacterized damage-inducible protein DinB
MEAAMTTTAAPCAIAAPLSMIFAANDMLLHRALDGISKADLWHRPTDKTNAILWVAGHAVQTRTVVLQILGEPFDTGWGNLFERGAELQEQGLYPTCEEVERVAREINSRLLAKLASLDEHELNAAIPKPIGPGVKTLAEQIAFFALHDSYHIGQLAYIRKALGHTALAG